MFAESSTFPPWEIHKAETIMLVPVAKLALKADAQVQAMAEVHGSVGECHSRWINDNYSYETKRYSVGILRLYILVYHVYHYCLFPLLPLCDSADISQPSYQYQYHLHN